VDNGARYLGVRRPRREYDHSHPTSAETKGAWSDTSTSCRHGEDRDNVTFNSGRLPSVILSLCAKCPSKQKKN